MIIYLAAPLFNGPEKEYNQQIADMLECSGHSVILPQDYQDEDPLDLYNRCVSDATYSADMMVAVLNGPDVDSGVSYELGMVKDLMPIVGLRDDIRPSQVDGLNLMIRYGIDHLCSSMQELKDKVMEISDSMV